MSGARLLRRTRGPASSMAAAWVPLALLLVLGSLALLRMPSANTLWYEERSVDATVNTADEFPGQCDDVALETTAITAEGGNSVFTYTLSGGGEACQERAISNISMGVCFGGELGSGPVINATQPPGWAYSGSNAHQNLKWETTNSDQNGIGPFEDLHFSVTLQGTDYPTDTIAAYAKAGPGDDAIGEVMVPACPLPAGAQTSSGDDRGTTGTTDATTVDDDPTPKPTPEPNESQPPPDDGEEEQPAASGEDRDTGDERDDVDGGQGNEDANDDRDGDDTDQADATPSPTNVPDQHSEPEETNDEPPEEGYSQDGGTYSGYAELP